MNRISLLASKAKWLPERILRWLVVLLTGAAGLGILAMMLITCLDVLLRVFGHPLIGAFDVVKIAGAIAITCALPYTTAIKGHVAIEYFFQKLSRRARVMVDTLARLVGIALFGSFAWQAVRYGISLKHNGQVTSTLEIPIYWIPYVMAFSCAVVALVIFHNLLHPGREMIKP